MVCDRLPFNTKARRTQRNELARHARPSKSFEPSVPCVESNHRVDDQAPGQSTAFRVAAGKAGIAVLQPNETRRTAARAEPGRRAFRGDRNGAHLFADEWALARAHEPDRDEVTFDHFADGRQNRRNITAAHPLPAAWIKDGLQLIYDKGHVAAPAEDRADHA